MPPPESGKTAFRPLEAHEKIMPHHATFKPGEGKPHPAFQQSIGKRQGDASYQHFAPSHGAKDCPGCADCGQNSEVGES